MQKGRKKLFRKYLIIFSIVLLILVIISTFIYIRYPGLIRIKLISPGLPEVEIPAGPGIVTTGPCVGQIDVCANYHDSFTCEDVCGCQYSYNTLLCTVPSGGRVKTCADLKTPNECTVCGCTWAGEKQVSISSTGLTCSVKSDCSDAGEVPIFRMSSTNNAMAGTVIGSSYSNIVCCSGVNGLGNSCSGSNNAVVLKLNSATNSHVAYNGETNANYGIPVCVSGPTAGVSCTYSTGSSCPSDYACLASVSSSESSFTNAHVGDCISYTNKICCRVPSEVTTTTTSSTTSTTTTSSSSTTTTSFTTTTTTTSTTTTTTSTECSGKTCGYPCGSGTGICDGAGNCYTVAETSKCVLNCTLPQPPPGYTRDLTGSCNRPNGIPKCAGDIWGSSGSVCDKTICQNTTTCQAITGKFSSIDWPQPANQHTYVTGEIITVTVRGVTATSGFSTAVECRLNKSDGTGIEFDRWVSTYPTDVTFSYTVQPTDPSGTWSIDYCVLATDFYVNKGWLLQTDWTKHEFYVSTTTTSTSTTTTSTTTTTRGTTSTSTSTTSTTRPSSTTSTTTTSSSSTTTTSFTTSTSTTRTTTTTTTTVQSSTTSTTTTRGTTSTSTSTTSTTRTTTSTSTSTTVQSSTTTTSLTTSTSTTSTGPSSTTTTSASSSTTTTTISTEVFDMSNLICNKSTTSCSFNVDRNTHSRRVVVFVYLFKEPEGIKYFSSNVNIMPGTTGRQDLILSEIKSCPAGITLKALALAYREDDLTTYIKRLKVDAFTC